MKNKQKTSFGEICAHALGPRLRNDLRGDWAIALLCYPTSIPFIWGALRLGVRPMTVTVFNLILALALPVMAVLLPLNVAVWAVALAGFFFHVFDCVDGSLARLTHTATPKGADVDFLVDMTQWGLLYASIGILADATLNTGFFWAAIAASSAWGRLLARVIRDRLRDGSPSKVPTEPLCPAEYLPAFLAGISGVIPFFALSGSYLGMAVAFLAIYSLLDIMQGLLPLFKRP